MSGSETAIVAAIVAVFGIFMIVLAWADMHTSGSRPHWD
jgi:hypothetical protein